MIIGIQCVYTVIPNTDVLTKILTINKNNEKNFFFNP